MRISWQGYVYNEFRECWMRWHDYVSIMVHNFPIVLVRRYDWLEEETSTLSVILFGFRLK